jgi:NAD(P)-dependent dehydrogenase (short-subunit alcohol dehydrogenase family)
MNRIDGKIALITGAAQGIGAETARILAAAGATVLVTDRDQDRGHRVTEEINRAGQAATFLALDVADEANWQLVAQQVDADFGGLDILVNNAGIVVVGPIEHTALADLERICQVNLHGTFLGLKHAVPVMKARAQASSAAGGSIVNVSSAVGIKGYPFGAAYSMTKGGVRLLTKSAALEFAELGYNIRVNSIHPGLVDTPMLTQEAVEHAGLGSLGSDSAAETRQFFENMAPIKRFAAPVEIARAVLFLASDDSSFMTGSELVVDGGDTAG